MNLFKSIIKRLSTLWKKFISLSLLKKLIILVILGLIIFAGYKLTIGKASNTPQYETATATKDTLVVALTESGSVSVANKVSVVTQASGIINNIYVKSGDYVTAGQVIADITLDTAGQQRQAQAYSSLLSAQNSINSANANLYSLQSQLFVANQKFVNDKGISNPTDSQKSDPTYIEEQANWLAAEAAYNNQAGVISAAQANVNNASLSYQLTSGSIVAPTSGTIGDLTVAKGMQIGSSNTTSGSNSTSNQAIATIKTGDSTIVSVNVSEVDAPQIKIGQKATITFDALTNKTFTGKIVGIDTTGSVSSGVTTYPALIQLDVSDSSILPNMSATASIITKIDDNVLLVPSTAVQTVGETYFVRILKNGKLTQVEVTTGDKSDSQTVIKSGISEGDTVVTSVTSTSTTTTSSSSSPFSGTGLRLGGNAGFGGGGGTTIRTTNTGGTAR